MNDKKVTFIICTEKGDLERKSLLLVESIRRFTKRFSTCDIISIAPREGHEIAQETKRKFENLKVQHYDVPLNDAYKDYPLANKPLSCAYVEENIDSDYFVFVDSDQLFFNAPDECILDDKHDVGLRPVDVKNIGSNGSDENYDYWQKLYDILDVKNQKYVISTVDEQKILQYWNSGLITVKSETGLFKEWKKNFMKVMENGLQPGQGEFFIEQSVFAATVSSMNLNVYEFSNSYNYPLHMQNQIPVNKRLTSLEEATTLHYHYMLKDRLLIKALHALKPTEDQKKFINKSI